VTQDSIFAQDVVLDPDTGRSSPSFESGGAWRDGAKIAILVGAQMYDLNGKLLGNLAAGHRPLPIRSETWERANVIGVGIYGHPPGMTIETLDVALDLLLLSLLIFGVTLLLRIHLRTGVVGGAVARIVGRFVRSTERLETAREAIDALEEIHEQAIAALERRLQVVEAHLGHHQSKTDN
jgi:hypothetical protein